jgi:hypothetical protein
MVWRIIANDYFKKHPDLKEDDGFLSQLFVDLLAKNLQMYQFFDIFLLSFVKKPIDLSSEYSNPFIGRLFSKQFNEYNALEKKYKKFFYLLLIRQTYLYTILRILMFYRKNYILTFKMLTLIKK